MNPVLLRRKKFIDTDNVYIIVMNMKPLVVKLSLDSCFMSPLLLSFPRAWLAVWGDENRGGGSLLQHLLELGRYRLQLLHIHNWIRARISSRCRADLLQLI